MRKQTLSLVAGVSLLALTSAAQADDAVVLGEGAMDAVTAAGTILFDTNVTKDVLIVKNVTVDVDKAVTTTVNLTGNLATAEASADAIGADADGRLAETETFAQVTAGGAFAFSDSLAAIDFGGGDG